MSEIEKAPDVAALTVELLGAYLANNTVPSEELAGLIRSTRAALTEDVAPVEPEAEAPTFTPAVSVRKSLASPDHLISLIDGKPYKILKRHLTTHGLTPDTYRERYGLPASYPMVAPTFAALRRSIAETIGLGNRKKSDATPAVEATSASQNSSIPKPAAASAVSEGKTQTAKKVPAKASGRKAKLASNADVALANTVDAAAPVPVSKLAQPDAVSATIDRPVVGKVGAKPATMSVSAKVKKQPVKRMARAPKSTQELDAPNATLETVAKDATEVTPAVVKKPKARGKLVLFGKDSPKQQAPSSPAGSDSNETKGRWKRPGAGAD
jgi:predicted transcriptional regulator